MGPDTQRRLTAAGIDHARLRELADHQREYDQGGMWSRMTLGSVADELRSETAEVAERWRAALAEAEQALHDAEAARERDVAPHVAAAARLGSGHSTNPYPELRRATDYVGPDGTDRADGLTYTKFGDVEPFPGRAGVVAPLAVSARSASLTVVPDGVHLTYEQACAGVRSIILDRLATAAPRSMIFTWIDPVRQGHSAGPLLELLELDPRLIDTKVWSEPDDITAALRRVTDRIAKLHQTCLRDTYADLDAYNAEAGSLAEPHQVVVVTGFPARFGEDAVDRLRQILETGSTVGVSLYLVTDPDAHAGIRPGSTTDAGYLLPTFVTNRREGETWPGFGMFMPHPLVFGHAGSAWVDVVAIGRPEPVYTRCTWEPFDDRAARAIVHGYGTASVDAPAVVIDSSRFAVTGPPSGTSAESLDVPVGVRGRGTEVALRLGRGLEQNVLVGGLPGSGKSSLFHTIIVNAVRRYTPDELQLYLLDFKQGVEFQPYAAGALPHARVVAVQSEREFGLSVLRGLRREIDDRAALFRGPQGRGADSLREYRERTGKPLPRVLVVIDEFQVIFAEDDPIAHECASHLDHVVRQGRAFGVHTVLGTQTLRGGGVLGMLRGTIDQIAARVVLKSSDADARLFLADDNPAGGRPRPPRPGDLQRRRRRHGRQRRVPGRLHRGRRPRRHGRPRAAARRRPGTGPRAPDRLRRHARAVDIREDRGVYSLVTGQVPRDARVLRAHLGASVAIGGTGCVELRRDAGAHLLVCDRDHEPPSGSSPRPWSRSRSRPRRRSASRPSTAWVPTTTRAARWRASSGSCPTGPACTAASSAGRSPTSPGRCAAGSSATTTRPPAPCSSCRPCTACGSSPTTSTRTAARSRTS